MSVRTLIACGLAAVALGCTPATTTADAAPAPKPLNAATPAIAQPAKTNELGTLGGQSITLGDLTEKQRGALVRHDAKAALDRWNILRTLALEAAGNRALQVGGKAAGLSPEQFLKKMEQEVPLNPVTPEIIQAVYMGNQHHFQGQSLDQVKDVIAEQLGQEFRATQEHEIRDRLLERFPFVSSLKAPILPRLKVERKEAPSMGGSKAKVSVVIFSDFECPYCGRQAQINESLAQHYGDQVRWSYRHYPLNFHKHAAKIALASICAHDQGKFWAFHDRIFAQRDGFERAGLRAHAQAVGVQDMKTYDRCLDDPTKGKIIDDDIAAGDNAFIEGTPALFINGQPLYNLVKPDALQALINAELKANGVKPPPPLKHQQ